MTTIAYNDVGMEDGRFESKADAIAHYARQWRVAVHDENTLLLYSQHPDMSDPISRENAPDKVITLR